MHDHVDRIHIDRGVEVSGPMTYDVDLATALEQEALAQGDAAAHVDHISRRGAFLQR